MWACRDDAQTEQHSPQPGQERHEFRHAGDSHSDRAARQETWQELGHHAARAATVELVFAISVGVQGRRRSQ